MFSSSSNSRRADGSDDNLLTITRDDIATLPVFCAMPSPSSSGIEQAETQFDKFASCLALRPYGRQIRSGLRSIPEDIADQRALFIEDRIDHLATKVAPALAFIRANPGFAILQSRSILSAAAYQPYGEGDDGLRETIQAELRIAPMPDAIIILDQLRSHWTELRAKVVSATLSAEIDW